MELDPDRLRAMLLDAYTGGFLLEHDFKQTSRYPLAGESVAGYRERLSAAFEQWLASTPLLGDAEGELLAQR